jgi:hypothetical protein
MVMLGSTLIGSFRALAEARGSAAGNELFLPLILKAVGALAEVPSGAVMFFNLPACPSGWSELVAAQGRAIVGLPTGGTLAGAVGDGQSDLEDRSHSHDVSPGPIGTTVGGGHSHGVNINYGSLTGTTGDHTHSVDPPPTYSAAFLSTEESVRGFTDSDRYIVYEAGHDHAVDVAPFTSLPSGDHSHGFSIDDVATTDLALGHAHFVTIPNTSSSTAVTSEVMPYLQLLVCQKD